MLFLVASQVGFGRAGAINGSPGSGGLESATAKPEIVVLANSIDYGLAADFFEFLQDEDLEIVRVGVNEFDDYNEERFIIILGGPDAYEGSGRVVQIILQPSEQEYLRTQGARGMYMKSDVWHEGQRVFVLGGSDRNQTRQAHLEYRGEVYRNILNSLGPLEVTTTFTRLSTTRIPELGLEITTGRVDITEGDETYQNETWIEIENIGNEPVDLKDWTLVDEKDRVYHFPRDIRYLYPGESVTVHLEPGSWDLRLL